MVAPEAVRQLFLCGISFTYLFAFASLYYQVPGLYGDKGILPVRSKLKCDKDSKLWQCAFTGSNPTLLHFYSALGLSPSECMDLLCLFGVLIASLQILFKWSRNLFMFMSLWVLYFSCFQVGQTFLWFQWDTLLLETGFLTCVVAFLRPSVNAWLPHDNVALWLVRWLCFRLMFASGVVKLTSECPTWWGLTALHWHFESQCIPTGLAWYAHNLFPDWFKKFSVVAVYITEIFIPLLFLLPVQFLRHIGFWSQVFLMFLIMLTGNYNFFNFVTIILSIPLLIDASESKLSTHRLRSYVGAMPFELVRACLSLGVIAVIAQQSITLFHLKLKGGTVQSELGFNKNDMYRALAVWVPWLMLAGVVSFVLEVFAALLRCFMDFSSVSLKLYSFIQTTFVCIVATVLFCISLVPLSYLDRGAFDMIGPRIKDWHKFSDKFQLTHSYGLFRSMTGVGGRPEVIIEGAMDEDGPWKEYEFQYKPGNLSRSPPFLIPHQPRLDWQLWFAALGSHQHNPWFISLIYRLLNNEPSVLKLIQHNPFPNAPPRLIRANLYHYHFTSAKSKDRTNWWWREWQHEYMPPIVVTNPSVVNYLDSNGFIIQSVKQPKRWLNRTLDLLRWSAEKLDGAGFVWAVTVSVLAVKTLL